MSETVERVRGDTLWTLLSEVLSWCRADMLAMPHVPAYKKRYEKALHAVKLWERKTEGPGAGQVLPPISGASNGGSGGGCT